MAALAKLFSRALPKARSDKQHTPEELAELCGCELRQAEALAEGFLETARALGQATALSGSTDRNYSKNSSVGQETHSQGKLPAMLASSQQGTLLHWR
jgi:hypothetical protein